MKTIRTLLVVLAVLGAWSCSSLDPIEPGTVNTGSLNFARYHSVGNSLTAGVVNGGLVSAFQKVSYPALIAEAAQAADFGMPTVSENGIPPTLYVSNFSPLTIDQLTQPGGPTNSSFPVHFNNLGIPGAKLHDLLVTRMDTGDPTKVFYNIVLRDSNTFGPTAVDQAVAARPTVMTVWIGANDVLGSATMGTDLLLTNPVQFETDYITMMNRFDGAADAIIAANLPDIVDIPFFVTIPPVVVNPATREPVLIGGNLVPLLGPGDLPITLTSLVTLVAAESLSAGVGIPLALGGTGRGLPSFMILDDAEQGGIDAGITAYNTTIDTVCTNRGIPVVDMFRLFKDVSANGVHIRGEGNTYTTEFLSGGLFSVDGVHPTSVGYWVAAREFIRVMNANFGAAIPEPRLPTGPLRDPGLGVTPNVVPAAAAATISLDEWRGLWMVVGVDPADMP